MRQLGSTRLASLWLGAALVALTAHPAPAFHTVFEFRTDRFELDGSAAGPHDGTTDFTDDFDDGALSPNWYQAYGTANESGGFLVLSNPGFHFPGPGGEALDVSVAASSGVLRASDGGGDFTATATWDPLVPAEGHHYHLSVFTFGGGGGGFFNETFGIGIQRDATGLFMEQHLTEIDQFGGIYQNTMLDFFPIDENDVTGDILMRLDFDDSTNLATSSFSLDGGTVWQSPFPSGEIFVGRTTLQFLLSADPTNGGGTTTTTTGGGTTTTSTTLPAGPCVATGCRGGTQLFKGRLGIKDKASDKSDSLAWKLRKGESTTLAAFGDPTSTTGYDVCIHDGSGATIFEATIPPGGNCGLKPCWKALGTKGFKYKGPGSADGIRLITLRAGEDGKAAVTVRGKGTELSTPPLPLNLPATIRLRNGLGECWAEVFTVAGVVKNTATQFSGKSGSPSGAFLD